MLLFSAFIHGLLDMILWNQTVIDCNPSTDRFSTTFYYSRIFSDALQCNCVTVEPLTVWWIPLCFQGRNLNLMNKHPFCMTLVVIWLCYINICHLLSVFTWTCLLWISHKLIIFQKVILTILAMKIYWAENCWLSSPLFWDLL